MRVVKEDLREESLEKRNFFPLLLTKIREEMLFGLAQAELTNKN